MKDLGLLITDCVCLERNRWFHSGKRDKLEYVVRDHVPQRTGGIVIAAALLDAEFFGHGDLNVVYKIAVPNRLKDAVAEAKNQNVLNRFFAEVMVDAIDLLFF